ncbi:MAG: hypothetical protein COA93_10330 [Alphaproteobacteria bacterium]|nr:MAG: hypothetical protein COA93_10330 [Alphaproteobacteria bacterium]
MGVIFYIVMDIIVLGAFLSIKAQTDMLVIYVSIAVMIFVFVGERLFLRWHSQHDKGEEI